MIGRRVDAGLLTSISRSGGRSRSMRDSAARSRRRILVVRRRRTSLPVPPCAAARGGLRRSASRSTGSGSTDGSPRSLPQAPTSPTRSPVVALAELARHWLGARAEPEAFAALVEAGRAALSADGLGRGAACLRGGARAVGPRSRSRLGWVCRGRACCRTRPPWPGTWATRGRPSSSTGGPRPEPDVRADLRRLGRLIDHEAWYVLEGGDIERARELGAEAVRIIPADPPSFERSMALGTLGDPCASARGECSTREPASRRRWPWLARSAASRR